MSDITERLRGQLVMSMFANSAALHAEQVRQRKEAADEIDRLRAELAGARELIDDQENCIKEWMPHMYCEHGLLRTYECEQCALASAQRAPDAYHSGPYLDACEAHYARGWNDCRRAILAAAKPVDSESQRVPDGAFHVPTLESVLRGLKSEDDSTQLRAIISEVEAMLAAAKEGKV